jgi:DNA-directed RNA polymerase subunit RPC12/RpoP
MAEQRTMREVLAGETPVDGGTAVQDDVDRPVFSGNGKFDYVCVRCGNVLAAGMDPEYMTRRVRIRCRRCATVNIAAENPVAQARRPRQRT